MRYDYSGPHLFSAWAIIRSDQHPLGVTANNTGTIPEYSTLSAFNATIIGMHWTGKVWQNFTQTGWYWDSNHSLLYLHFQTWSNAKYHETRISVDFPVAASGTITQTATTTATTTITMTTISIQTTTIFDKPHFFVAVASSDLSNNIFTGFYVNVHRVGDPNGVGYWPSGYTTYLFPVLTNGDSYRVCIFDTSSHFFNHWDDGTTDRCKVVSPTENILLVAYFSG